MKTEFTAKQLADHIGGAVAGDPAQIARGVASLANAEAHDLVFVEASRFEKELRQSKARLAILPEGIEPNEGMTAIRFPRPSLGFARALELFAPRRREFDTVSPQAYIGENVEIGDDVGIAPGVFVGEGCRIGSGTEIHPGVTIGRDVSLGTTCTIHSGAQIYADTIIGNRVVLHSGVVIGADGFGYVQDQTGTGSSPADPPPGTVFHRKIPQLGRVVIEDDVEVGANSTIDRAAFDTTRIGRGTKIDNLVMVAHNCQIGEYCLLVGQTGIAGSTTLGDHVTIAGQAGVAGHVKIGSGAMIAAQSGVMKSIGPGKTVIGTPASPLYKSLRRYALTRKLPAFREQLLEQEERIRALEKRAGE